MINRGTVVCVCTLFFSHQIELSQMVICLQNGWWQTWMCRSCWIIRTNFLWIVFLSCSYKHMADTGWWCWWTNHSWSCRPYISCRTYYAFPSSKSVRTFRTAQCHTYFMLIAFNLFTVLVWNRILVRNVECVKSFSVRNSDLTLTRITLRGIHVSFQHSGNTLPACHDCINIVCISENVTVL